MEALCRHDVKAWLLSADADKQSGRAFKWAGSFRKNKAILRQNYRLVLEHVKTRTSCIVSATTMMLGT